MVEHRQTGLLLQGGDGLLCVGQGEFRVHIPVDQHRSRVAEGKTVGTGLCRCQTVADGGLSADLQKIVAQFRFIDEVDHKFLGAQECRGGGEGGGVDAGLHKDLISQFFPQEPGGFQDHGDPAFGHI